MELLATYTTSQWFFFFYTYCLFGWIWETGLVSIRSRGFVNRGFMHGPFLPIYGSGAIVILISTIGVKDNVALIFLFGMISSTILEFFTGAAMEKLFHVRYWDYTDHKFNIKGHVCPFVSVGWGLFSILLVKLIHPPIEDMILDIPITIIDVSAFALTIIICIDMTISFNEAMDLKATLIKMAESNEELRRIQEKADFVYALAENDIKKFMEEKEERKHNAKERFMDNLEAARLKKTQRFEEMQRQIDDSEIVAAIEEQKKKLQQRTDKEYLALSKILRRNPGAVSKKHGKELSEIFDVLRK